MMQRLTEAERSMGDSIGALFSLLLLATSGAQMMMAVGFVLGLFTRETRCPK
jgi:hypothetical protein